MLILFFFGWFSCVGGIFLNLILLHLFLFVLKYYMVPPPAAFTPSIRLSVLSPGSL